MTPEGLRDIFVFSKVLARDFCQSAKTLIRKTSGAANAIYTIQLYRCTGFKEEEEAFLATIKYATRIAIDEERVPIATSRVLRRSPQRVLSKIRGYSSP